MADRGLRRQSDIEELTAWLDGELDPPAAERVARLVAEDADWRSTHEQFLQVAAAMELLRPAGPKQDLTDGIVRAAHRRRRRNRVIQVGTSVAAAAGILLAVLLTPLSRPATPPGSDDVEALIAKTLDEIPAEERFIVQNLSLFQQYEEIVDYQLVRQVVDTRTLECLEAAEAPENLH